jgi:hypothetical protein
MDIDRTIALYLILLGLEIVEANTALAKIDRPSRLLQMALQLVQQRAFPKNTYANCRLFSVSMTHWRGTHAKSAWRSSKIALD